MAEVEIKFAVRDRALLESLEAASSIAGFPVRSRKTFEQTDEYWDTPASAAAANGVSVRQRTTGEDRLYTVKAGAVTYGFSRRMEIEEPAGEASLVEWLKALIEDRRVELPFDLDELAPKVRVHNRRTALYLAAPDGAEIELALDRVTFEGPGGHAQEMEIEGELLTGGESALHVLRDWIEAQPGTAVSHASKYERALKAVG